MVKPQQPELHRSDRGATSEAATKAQLSASTTPEVDGGAGAPVPTQNQPGHRPDHEQDKPTGQDFVAKMHSLAQRDAYNAPSTEDEVFDLTQIDADEVHDGAPPREASNRGEVLAQLAGKPFALAGAALGAMRKRLPGD